MPVFSTPGPISATIDLRIGDITIIASDRTDTVVDIRPGRRAWSNSQHVVDQIRVEFSQGRLLVQDPRQVMFIGRNTAVDVTIELPIGSAIHAQSALGDLSSTGLVGDSVFTTSAGNITLDQTGALRAVTSKGDISVNVVQRDASIRTSAGTLRLGVAYETATLKSSSGSVFVGEALGDLRVKSANGAIHIERAQASVDAKTSRGEIRVGEVSRGIASVHTAAGSLSVGIREGSAAWVDATTSLGSVNNSLTPQAAAPTGDSVEVHARTSTGNISIHRSSL